MALREYRDLDGRPWMVWSVAAKFNPVRSETDRRTTPSARSEERTARSQERRVLQERRGAMPPPEWMQGWLCFQTTGEKRRLIPVPEGWERSTVRELEELRKLASPIALS